ncbi:hypothetical protein [uncultured Fusobacterium sp.]|jgi:hypothetical protein|uniref:hypothetical protein n=1 Tax=uncultured Fusobacterium sp. TaxID=159267 RepID=UPI0025D4C654|nr:hypothetical protein [uncultured Fusobacterium sp.]
MFKKKENKIILSDEDILHSLNYNIIIKERECDLDKNNILYTDYMTFNHQDEIKQYYSKENNFLELYITKLNKFKQLVNNIALYLNIPKDEILYRYEKNIIYTNIYKLVKKYKIKKKFDFIIFFKKFEWIDGITKLTDRSLKIKFSHFEILTYTYKILEENYLVMTASRNENEFIILDPVERKIKIGIKYPKK